jgi:hypothetical protein
MRDTDKRVGGWEKREGGWKKKKKAAPVEVPVETKPAPKRKEPEPNVQPERQSKIKPKPALALKDEEPAETFSRKYKEKTRATQGKFEKRRTERRAERRDEIPPTIQEREEGRATKYIKRSADAARVIKTSRKNIAKRTIQALLDVGKTGVTSVTQGLADTARGRLMGAMVQRLQSGGRVKGYKAPALRGRRDRG